MQATRECVECGNEYLAILPEGEQARAERCSCQRPCPLCRDQGFHFERDERGYEMARPCRCESLDRRIRNLNQARLPARYAGCSFHTFEAPDLLRQQLRAHANRFARDFTEGQRGVLYYGPCGTGKTHLLVAILRHLVIKRGIQVRFVDFQHLLADLRATFNDRGRAETVMGPLVAIPVLAVDELGKGSGSEWELSVLDQIISRRYNANRTTLFTSNYFIGPPTVGLASLEDRVGERIYSRLMEMCQPQYVGGEDYRRRSARAAASGAG